MTTTTQRLKPAQSPSLMNSSDHRPTVVLCSSKDDHLLSQDICTLCGSLGKSDEGNLISCSQCGQCYHPYCVNIKGLKVVVSKGWRCLECTVCETCGQPGDEAKLMLCDECELSFHTYCLDPPLEDVPQGSWKCHWCVACQKCGAHTPGIESDWQKNYTECGPCSSLSTCPKCKDDYIQGDLIIKCSHCSRWLHSRCDSIRDEEECELASELGYTCLLCRPRDEIPLYIVHRKTIDSASQNNTNNIDQLEYSNQNETTSSANKDYSHAGSNHLYDSSEYKRIGLDDKETNSNITENQIKSSSAMGSYSSSPTRSSSKQLQSEFPRPQSAPLSSFNDTTDLDSTRRPSSSMHFNKEELKGLNDSEENSLKSNISKRDEALTNGINSDGSVINRQLNKFHDELLQASHMVDGIYLSETGFDFIKSRKLEPAKRQRAKRGAKVQKLDESNIEDINRDDDEENKLITDDKVDEEGRKKRVRKLSKVGIGGFIVRQRGVRINKEDDFNYSLSHGTNEISTPPPSYSNASLNQQPHDKTNETLLTASATKPKRIRKKPKKKTNLIDQYPSYLQEAFFGKELLSFNELKAEEKYSESLNDCPAIENQVDESVSKSLIDNDSISRVSSDISKTKMSNNKMTEGRPLESPSNTTDSFTKTGESGPTPKEDSLMDVLMNDSQTADSAEPNTDLLSTEFDLNLVGDLCMDSKAVEDILNDLGPQTANQRLIQLPQGPETYDQAFTPTKSLPAPNSTVINNTSNLAANSHQQSQPIHQHQHQSQQPSQQHVIPSQPMHPHIQTSGSSVQPQTTTVHHVQSQPPNQMISSSLSPQQANSMHQAPHQISPTIIQQPQNINQMQQAATQPPPPHPSSFEVSGRGSSMPVHSSNINPMSQVNQCNLEQNSPVVVNTPGPILSPSVTLSPRTKMSSPCITSTHRPPSTASSVSQIPSSAQHHHHPLPPPNQSNQPSMSPLVESEAGNSQYSMPPSPWTGSQPDLSRQYSSPHVTSEMSWQSQNTGGQEVEPLSQSKKNSQILEQEEALGAKASKAAFLFANLEHPNLRQEYRTSDERYKQVQKLWRQLPPEKRKPYQDKARENRSASKISSSKTVNETLNVSKKLVDGQTIQHAQHPKMLVNDGSHLQQHQPQLMQQPQHQQQVHMNQPPTMVHQSQDTRWKQPIAVEGQIQSTRFLPSPHSHRPPSHMSHDTTVVCHPPEAMSPSQRPINETGMHYDHSPQPSMISPQTSSPRPPLVAFNRPPSQQHPMIVPRVRPQTIDQSRNIQNPDPYAMPPSTPRPLPLQQRSPFSPQSPFPQHSVTPVSSTSPLTTRAPNDHQVVYQSNQHTSVPQNQPLQQAGVFVEPQHQSHMQQPNQYPVIRQPAQYTVQQQSRLSSPMQQQPQYVQQSHITSNQNMAVRGPLNPQMHQQMHPQQNISYQQQSQYRQPQPTPRYPNQHQELHSSSLHTQQQQSNLAPPLQPAQQIHQQRIQSPIAQQRQIPQAPIQHHQQRMMNQPRMQHPLQQGQSNLHQVQQQHQITQSTMSSQQIIQPQQQQQSHQLPPQQLSHVDMRPQQQTTPQPHYPPQNAQLHYNTIQTTPRIELDDPTQLPEDEDDLKDLGADFNILEYADPETEKSASTSAGKNNIELDPELEDYPFDTDPEERKPNDQVLAMNSQQPQIASQQQQQPQHQVVYSQVHQQHQQNVQMQQNFVENHLQHGGLQQPQTNILQQNQYPTQRQIHYVNQQRMPVPIAQQYNPNNQQVIRSQQTQVRAQHPQAQPPLQQMNYQHRPQQAQPRYHTQNHISHDMHQQQHVPQQMMQQQQQQQPQQTMMAAQQANPQQHQRVSQMQVNQPQYLQQGGFIDSNQQVQQQQQVHGNMHQQYSQQQQPQQQHIMYNNHQQPHHNQQMNVRRQFQPQPQQQQQQYSYQTPHQTGYSPMMDNSQHIIKSNNEMIMHDKNPIVGETITSMEFNMYQQGSGSANEAVNLPIQTTESSNLNNSNQDRSLTGDSDGSTITQGMSINFGSASAHDEQVHADLMNPMSNPTHSTSEANPGTANIKPNQELLSSPLGKQEANFHFAPAPNVVQSGRLSSCSNSQETDQNNQAPVTNQNTNSERAGASQPQNQLLKQLLGNCSSADNPPSQDIASSSSILVDSSNKVPMQPTGHGLLPKPISGGIPSISFQLDSANKTGGSLGSIGALQQPLNVAQPVKAPNMIASSLQPQRTINQPTTTTTTISNQDIKTFNATQQVQPTVNLNIAPRVQTVQQHVSAIILRADGQTIVHPADQSQQQQLKQQDQHTTSNQQQIISITTSNMPLVKKVKTSDEEKVQLLSQQPNRQNFTPVAVTPSSSLEAAPQQPGVIRPSSKTSTTKRKNDYIAERRAALEKEKTPPPREVKKPKGRVRGPNKRSRGQLELNEEIRTTDSNSNTSEASQQLDGSNGPQPKKRARKSQNKIPKLESENSETILSSLALKISRELPTIFYKEPDLVVNNNIGSIFGCGDLNVKSSRLQGSFGKAVPVAGNLNFSSTKKGKRKTVGYYHEEFPRNLEETQSEAFNRRIAPRILDQDCESPRSIISGSSSDYEDTLPERNLKTEGSRKGTTGPQPTFEHIFTPDLDRFSTHQSNQPNYTNEFNGHDIMDINNNERSMSPSIPIEIRLPTRSDTLFDIDRFEREDDENNKENLEQSAQTIDQETPVSSTTPEPTGTSLSMRLKEHGNVSVTLTLTNKEADGVKRVLNSLSKLIDYPIQPSCVMQSPSSVTGWQSEEGSGLGGSFRLLTHSSNNHSSSSPTDHKEIKFNEQSYVPMETEDDDNFNVKKPDEELLDIKPEFCCRCKAIVVDKGIRKNMKEIPPNTIDSMQDLSNARDDKAGELVFCSVQCYVSSIMCLNVNSQHMVVDKDDKKSSTYSVKAPPGLPPMSPMMEDDEDDVSNNNRVPEPDKNKPTDKSPIFATLDSNQKRKWVDVKYTRWTPSHFNLHKSTNTINKDDMKNTLLNEHSPNTAAAHLVGNGESSVDSNESDNSTSYSQSTSGKLGSFCNQDISMKSRDVLLTAGNRYNVPRDLSANKDVIAPWPEGMEMIQVRPIKQIVTVKKENHDEREIDAESTGADKMRDLINMVELYQDTRKCVLCHEVGDGETDGPARLLNLFIGGWVHLNCALWSLDVYELRNGGLMNVELACKKAMTCVLCNKPGATLKCFKLRCPNYYHFLCAIKEKCAFYEDKSFQCRQHSKSAVREMTSFVVKRRVYVNRDEQKQVAEMIQGEQQNVIRIGSLVFYNIGQLFPHQLQAFHDQNNIFPIGYRVVRYYWSYRRFNKRCKYLCTIEDNDGKPQFRIIAQEVGYEDEEFIGDSPQTVWRPIIDMIVDLRKEVPDTITTYPAYIRGEDLFGLTDPNIVRILESLPGVEGLTDYDFKFGRSPLLELPLAINPTGCARTEPKLRTHFKRPYTIHTASSVPKSRLQSLSSGDTSSPYIKQFVHSKSSQYRKMKSEWRNNVVLARSRVQGLGLYAARDIEKHTMVIEYIGMLIRNEIAERYERIHEAHNRGIYMFRLDEDRVIDATLAGGLARYINHSCNPNCVAEAVEIDRERKILIIANRKILKGEELGYDYKLAIEDDQHKISCLCGAPTCKKWMN